MVNLFFQVVDLSVTASYVILAILVLRLCLRKAPKRCSYLLWAAAGFRLACPVSFESALSFFNLGQLLERKTTAVQNYVNQTSVQSPAVQRIPLPISELPAESQMPTEAARFSLNQNTLFTAIWPSAKAMSSPGKSHCPGGFPIGHCGDWQGEWHSAGFQQRSRPPRPAEGLTFSFDIDPGTRTGMYYSPDNEPQPLPWRRCPDKLQGRMALEHLRRRNRIHPASAGKLVLLRSHCSQWLKLCKLFKRLLPFPAAASILNRFVIAS